MVAYFPEEMHRVPLWLFQRSRPVPTILRETVKVDPKSIILPTKLEKRRRFEAVYRPLNASNVRVMVKRRGVKIVKI